MTTPTQIAVVTGGGRGIGRGIVLELAKLRMSLVVNYRSDLAAAEATCEDAVALGAVSAVPIQADVARVEEGQALVGRVVADFGRIDLWVNNAGVAPERRLDLLETTAESWDRVLNTNLRGPFFLTQCVARELMRLAAERVVSEPKVVFITSVSSTFASVNRSEYCVSKAGLSMVASLFAVRLAEHGVQVHEVRPGVVATEMTGAVREKYDRRIAEGLSPTRRWGTPEDVGRAVAAIAAGSLPFSTGNVIYVDGGLHLGRL